MPVRPAFAIALTLVGALILGQACFTRAEVVTPPSAPVATVSTTDASGAASTTTTAPSGTPAAIPDGYRVKVPRLLIDLPIAEGVIQRDIDQQQTPEGFAFHLPGTAIPGRTGNTYLYSHARVGMFLSLWNARVGDDVLIVAPDGRTLRYAVSEVRPRVPPSDVSVVAPTDDERVTLQTSTGPAPQDPRFVVIALPQH
jgi:sortase (surface protein transpeptidase)